MCFDSYVEEMLFEEIYATKLQFEKLEHDDYIVNCDDDKFDCRYFLDKYPGKRYVKFDVDGWDIYNGYFAEYDLSDSHDRELFLNEKWLSYSPEIVYIGDNYISFCLF